MRIEIPDKVNYTERINEIAAQEPGCAKDGCGDAGIRGSAAGAVGGEQFAGSRFYDVVCETPLVGESEHLS